MTSTYRWAAIALIAILGQPFASPGVEALGNRSALGPSAPPLCVSGESPPVPILHNVVALDVRAGPAAPLQQARVWHYAKQVVQCLIHGYPVVRMCREAGWSSLRCRRAVKNLVKKCAKGIPIASEIIGITGDLE